MKAGGPVFLAPHAMFINQGWFVTEDNSKSQREGLQESLKMVVLTKTQES